MLGRTAILGVLLAGLAMPAGRAMGPDDGKKFELPLHLTALGVNMAFAYEHPSGQAATVNIRIDRWSTPDERQRLMTTLRERGPGLLLEDLRETEAVGQIRTPDSLGWDLHYASVAVQPDGTRRIHLATDRPISFWEARNQPRVSDYPFTVVEIRLGPDGEGEGKLALATKVRLTGDGDHIQLVTYASEPVRLQNVQVVS